jgi:hypothetical protein
LQKRFQEFEMIVTEDAKPPHTPPFPPKPRNSGETKRPSLDPWADWKPVWNDTSLPHSRQEKHSPTVPVKTVRTTVSAVSQPQTQRRIVDARLWAALTPAQQTSALEIALAFETLGRGLGYIASDWKRIPGCRGQSNAADAHARLVNTYIDWTQRCQRKKVSHAMIVDVLVFGFSCRQVDRDRRQRTGTARKNLVDGLCLYCALKGWPEN